MTEMEILTPKSPRWDEFADRLYAVIDVCGGNHQYAKQVMVEMGNVDIPGSLAFFEDHGGYCDCEICSM